MNQRESQPPLVSVIMPTYNSASTLMDACVSILNQHYRNLELLVIDDGSQDETQAVLSLISDNRLKIILNPKNLGIVKSLNLGIENAKGTLIARMDADDISEADRLTKQVDFMERNPHIGVCGSAYRKFDDGGNTFQTVTHPLTHEEIMDHFLLGHSVIAHPSVIIRRNVLGKEFRYREDFKYCEDYDLWNQLSLLTHFANLPDSLIRYRISQGSISARKRQEQSDLANIVKESFLLKPLDFVGNGPLWNLLIVVAMIRANRREKIFSDRLYQSMVLRNIFQLKRFSVTQRMLGFFYLLGSKLLMKASGK